MKPLSIFIISAFSVCSSLVAQIPANSFSYSCTKDTFINCSNRCFSLQTQIPDVRSSTQSYKVIKASEGGCFRPPVSHDSLRVSIGLSNDTYSPVIPIPFEFPFYNIIFSQVVVGENGTVSFDLANSQNTGNADILSGNTPQNLPNALHDRAVIMGVFHDLQPSGDTRYYIIGTAPHRKWILSFKNKQLNNCSSLDRNSHQIVLHEATGIVEIFVFDKQICTSRNQGRAIIGMQDYERVNGIMAPGRSASAQWGGLNMNESWRFIPASGASLLKKTALYTINGEYIMDGDTSAAGNGNLQVVFNNVCSDSSASYIVKSSFYHFMYPFQFPVRDSIAYATDTIRVIKNDIAINASTTPGDCLTGTGGGLVVTAPVSPNYSYSLTDFVYQTSTGFSNLSPGTKTVFVKDNTTGCIHSRSFFVPGINQAALGLEYPKTVYCITDTSGSLPIVTGTMEAGTYSVTPAGLSINSITGKLNIPQSDTGLYVITFKPNNPDPCVQSNASTTIRIVNSGAFVWTGAVNSDWENAGNWSCNTVPGSTANVFIYEGNVVVSSNVTINSLYVAPGANIIVGSGNNVTVLQP